MCSCEHLVGTAWGLPKVQSRKASDLKHTKVSLNAIVPPRSLT